MAANTPDITAPVSRGRNASIGTVMNFGTAQSGEQGSGAGTINNSKGGVVDNGVASFQNAAKNSAYMNKEGNGGASKATSTSSQNIVSIQADTTNDIASEYVVRSTSGSVNAGAAGNYASLPRSDKAVDMPVVDPGAVRTNNASLVGQTYQDNPHFGENLSAGSTTNAERIVANRIEVENNPNKKIDGKKPLGDTTNQGRAIGRDGLNSNDGSILLPRNATEAVLSGEYTGLQSN